MADSNWSRFNKNDDEFLKYIEGNKTYYSSYDENEELDRWNSLNNRDNEAIYLINKPNNIDVVEIESYKRRNQYTNNENQPITYKHLASI